jgi:hypothetical protein
MKKINLGKIKDILTREQMKVVLGGDDYGGTGSCYDCTCDSMSSCWYFSGGDPNFGCTRVYTSCAVLSSTKVACHSGCTLN